MRKKILLIDSDADIRDILTFILQDAGYIVLATDRIRPLDAIANASPDLVLVDEWFSGRPGHRLCHENKNLPAYRSVPVIILSTANNVEEIKNDCQADDYIRKPFDLPELLQKVNRQ